MFHIESWSYPSDSHHRNLCEGCQWYVSTSRVSCVDGCVGALQLTRQVLTVVANTLSVTLPIDLQAGRRAGLVFALLPRFHQHLYSVSHGSSLFTFIST